MNQVEQLTDTGIPLREGNVFNVDAMEQWLIDNFKGKWWYHPTWFVNAEGNQSAKFIHSDDPERTIGFHELQQLANGDK